MHFTNINDKKSPIAVETILFRYIFLYKNTLVIILFITYQQFETPSQAIELIERSVSQKVLSLYKDQIDEFMPKGLLSSTFTRYEELMLNCKLYN